MQTREAYSSHDASQTFSSTSRKVDSGRGFPFSDGLLSSAVCKALLICWENVITC